MPPTTMLADDGRPVADDAGLLLPHYRTFSALFNTFNRTYRYTWDEAVRDNPDNALAMRRDAYLTALLRERMYPTAELNWTLEPENPKDAQQKAAADLLKQVVQRTPYFTKFLMAALDALWYGRAGVQMQWGPKEVMGQQRLAVTDWSPVNGDKIHYTWDGVPQILINAGETVSYRDEDIVRGDRATMLKLAHPYWRQRFVIHKHEVDDADYFDGEMAGARHGVGIRSRIYWSWWLRDEMLSWAVDYMEKVGTLGLLIFYYEQGNAASKAAAEEAARSSSRKAALAMPKPMGDDKQTSGVELLPASTAGITALQDMIANYFERHMERLVIGQSLSGSAQSTGLGSSVADLHADTKFRILKFDAENLQETLTTDLVEPAKRWNLPWARFPIFFKFSVPQPENKDKMEAVVKAAGLGVTFKADEVRELTGMSKPIDGDEVVGGKPEQPPGMPGMPGQPPQPGQPAPQPGSPPQPGQPPQQPPPGQPPQQAARPDEPQQYAAEFDEKKHPRAADGKFGSGGGGAKKGEPKAPYQAGRLTKTPLASRTKTLHAALHSKVEKIVAAAKAGTMTPREARKALGKVQASHAAKVKAAFAGRHSARAADMASHFGEGVHSNPKMRAMKSEFRSERNAHVSAAAKLVEAAAENVGGGSHDLGKLAGRMQRMSDGSAGAIADAIDGAVGEANGRAAGGKKHHGELTPTEKRAERYHAEPSKKRRAKMAARIASDPSTDWSELGDKDKKRMGADLARGDYASTLKVHAAVAEHHTGDEGADEVMRAAWEGKPKGAKVPLDPKKLGNTVVVDTRELSEGAKAMLAASPTVKTFLGSHLRVVTAPPGADVLEVAQALGSGLSLGDEAGMAKMFDESSAPVQVAVGDVPDEAKGSGKRVSGGAAKDASAVTRYRRLTADHYIAREPGKGGGYRVVPKSEVPDLIGVGGEHVGE